jgi:hypothetical protein
MHLELLKMRDGGWENIFTTYAIWNGLSGCVELIELIWYSQLRICKTICAKNQVLKINIDEVIVILQHKCPLLAAPPCSSME